MVRPKTRATVITVRAASPSKGFIPRSPTLPNNGATPQQIAPSIAKIYAFTSKKHSRDFIAVRLIVIQGFTNHDSFPSECLSLIAVNQSVILFKCFQYGNNNDEIIKMMKS
jgi:hypothetical protein